MFKKVEKFFASRHPVSSVFTPANDNLVVRQSAAPHRAPGLMCRWSQTGAGHRLACRWERDITDEPSLSRAALPGAFQNNVVELSYWRTVAASRSVACTTGRPGCVAPTSLGDAI